MCKLFGTFWKFYFLEFCFCIKNIKIAESYGYYEKGIFLSLYAIKMIFWLFGYYPMHMRTKEVEFSLVDQFVHYFSSCLHVWGTFKGLLSIWKVVSAKKSGLYVISERKQSISKLEKCLSVKLPLFKSALDAVDC